jgi:hypothetical protein
MSIPSDVADAQLTTSLHPGTPVTIDVQFQGSYRKWTTDTWELVDMQHVCISARNLQTIWSSSEFQAALSKITWLVLEADGNGTVTQKTTGPQILAKILGQPHIVINLAVTSKRGIVPNCAVSDFPPNGTAVQAHYISQFKYRCGEPPLIPALTNTLGHEYTHYDVIQSTDYGKFAAYNPNYVSYGIGCLTQNVGYPDHTCNYAPPQVAAQFKKPLLK